MTGLPAIFTRPVLKIRPPHQVFLGAQIFRRSLAAKIELTLITYWDNLESIKAFAGNDISQARLYPEDEAYQLEPDLSVQHYEVIEHQFSAEQRG